MRDALYDLVGGLDFDLAPWQQVTLLLVLLAAVGFVALVVRAARGQRRQRQLDEAIRRRYSVLR